VGAAEAGRGPPPSADRGPIRRHGPVAEELADGLARLHELVGPVEQGLAAADREGLEQWRDARDLGLAELGRVGLGVIGGPQLVGGAQHVTDLQQHVALGGGDVRNLELALDVVPASEPGAVVDDVRGRELGGEGEALAVVG
jgi:hypothetical protein